jgi:hypothetical protein
MIRLSKHTRDEMTGRAITQAFIEATLANPDVTMADPGDPAWTRSYRAIEAFGNRVLRVVHRPDGDDISSDDIFVVTAHWDRGARR